MPIAIADGAALADDAALATGPVLRGVGHGPRVTGRVVVIADLAAPTPVPAGAVVVVPAVTPSLALFVQGAAALVSEHGGALDHGAALARELGIPYVTGCRGATGALAPGDAVTVDGDAGTVTRLAPG